MADYRKDCRCSRGRERECSVPYDVLESLPVAMAYVPWQYFQEVYDLEKALCVGTIFPELDKPFLGAKGGARR